MMAGVECGREDSEAGLTTAAAHGPASPDGLSVPGQQLSLDGGRSYLCRWWSQHLLRPQETLELSLLQSIGQSLILSLCFSDLDFAPPPPLNY